MTFDELQLIFTDGSPEVQQKVWAQIKGTEIPFAAKSHQRHPQQNGAGGHRR